MRKRHYVIYMGDGESHSLDLMKDWLRRHPELLPPGTDPTHTTSHQLRGMLQKQGWQKEEQTDRVVLIQPDSSGSFRYAIDLLELENDLDIDIDYDSEELKFGLEKDMQDALRKDISQLEPNLTIIDGGAERITEAGRIDIIAKDEKNNIVALELKAGTAQPAIVAQIMAYIGAVQSEESNPVRGIIVAGDFNHRVILAARAIPNLELRQYSYQFSFKEIY